jgi:hypothetical protein
MPGDIVKIPKSAILRIFKGERGVIYPGFGSRVAVPLAITGLNPSV